MDYDEQHTVTEEELPSDFTVKDTVDEDETEEDAADAADIIDPIETKDEKSFEDEEFAEIQQYIDEHNDYAM